LPGALASARGGCTMPRAPEPPRTGTLALVANDFASRRTATDLARRMNAWGRDVLAKLRAAGLDVVLGEARDDSSEAGALRVVFSGRARAVLGLEIDAGGVRAGLELPAAQAHAVRAELANPERALELSTALEALPEQFALRVGGEDASLDAPRCTVDDVRAILDRVESTSRPLAIGWTVPRDVAVEHAALLDEQLKDALAALVRIFALFGGADDAGAPSRARPHEGAHGRRQSGRSDDDRDHTKKRQRETREPGRDRKGQREPDGPIRGRSTADVDGERDGATAAQRRHAAVKDGVPSRPPAAHEARFPLRGAARRRPNLKVSGGGAKGRGGSIERGARVRVLEGPFSGKVGVVRELDGKGGARVMLGLLAVRFDMANLAVHDERGRRPVLGTSHRKPVPVRS
jgi:hypothetical protein